ncbi:uncharacterized protein LOC128158019 [Crassostrea angulata]|uniref:uncharacterized protein LOC128158019 n=1 Tax=Magallana angulata TaxID=2784310 RepID=UPI0022B1C74E|nr:uncharacterized protein LOC128158019 [Crassostrea angulata]
MAIVFISVWTLIATTVLASISIKLEPSLIEFGKSGLDISCVVNDTNLIGTTHIYLKRSESYVVSVTIFKIAWQDKALENKTGVTVNGSINNTMTSYLRLEISKTVVRYREDMGSYQCILSAVTASHEIKRYQSQSIVLNITGFLESTTKRLSTSNHKSTEVSAQNGYQENSTESFINTDKPLQKKRLVLYRTIMIPITTIISGMLAFIVARELRLHYFVSKATTTAKNHRKKYTNGVYIV